MSFFVSGGVRHLSRVTTDFTTANVRTICWNMYLYLYSTENNQWLLIANLPEMCRPISRGKTGQHFGSEYGYRIYKCHSVT